MSSKKTLPRRRVEQLIASYGGDPERYPPGEVEPAKATIAEDDQLRTEARTEAALDLLLAHSQALEPGQDLQRKVAEIPLNHPRPSDAPAAKSLSPLPLRLWPSLGLAGLMACLGMYLGITVPMSDRAATAGRPVLAAATPVAPLQALSQLAFADDLAWAFLDLDDGALP